MNKIKELGNASFYAKIENGVITIKHGTDDAVLARWTANAGDWDSIWQVIRILENGSAVDIKEF